MCWDYSECGACYERTECIASCGCDDDDDCQLAGHRDCKSFDTCTTCYRDLCDDCYQKKCINCDQAYCDECNTNAEHHKCREE
jgi:hypothetical protein